MDVYILEVIDKAMLMHLVLK